VSDYLHDVEEVDEEVGQTKRESTYARVVGMRREDVLVMQRREKSMSSHQSQAVGKPA
jgi:hypothetical protein